MTTAFHIILYICLRNTLNLTHKGAACQPGQFQPCAIFAVWQYLHNYVNICPKWLAFGLIWMLTGLKLANAMFNCVHNCWKYVTRNWEEDTLIT